MNTKPAGCHRGLVVLNAGGRPCLVSQRAALWLNDMAVERLRLADGETASLVDAGGKRILLTLIDHTGTGERCLLLEECCAAKLSPCEIKILHWVDLGKSNEQIAQIRRVKLSTVKKHLEHIFEKLGVENRTAAASCLRELRGGSTNFN